MMHYKYKGTYTPVSKVEYADALSRYPAVGEHTDEKLTDLGETRKTLFVLVVELFAHFIQDIEQD